MDTAMESPVTKVAPPDPAAARLVVRPGRAADLEGLYCLALAAGSGLTNLPPNRDALAARLDASAEALDSAAARDRGGAILFVVEQIDAVVSPIVGTACIFAHVGADWPFYSYRMTRQSQTSRALGKKVTHDVMILVNDLNGSAEVGGLFVHSRLRGAAAGRLAARSRYLFMAAHRGWFGHQVIAELRGQQDAAGRSPVWEAVGREFYDMDFAEADYHNGTIGNQFIADLSPKHPIYASLLPREAREALGQPHKDSRPAMELLVKEGFRAAGYVDIFDGGPTLFAEIDDLKAVRESSSARVARIGPVAQPPDRLVSAGSGEAFRAARGAVQLLDAESAMIDSRLAESLHIGIGDEVRHVVF